MIIEHVDNTLGPNFFGLMRVSDGLTPFIRNGGQIINVTSSVGTTVHVPGEELKERILDENVTREGLL